MALLYLFNIESNSNRFSPHCKRFAFHKKVAKMSVAQELAAASGVPPAFRKQLESCSTFCKSESAGGVPEELRCVALRRVALRNHSITWK